jgi:dienelactone hydrolase
MRYWIVLAAALAAGAAEAKLLTQTVEYREGEVVLEGYLAYDDEVQGKRPGVLVVHEWYGLNDFARGKADALAQIGYVAFAADIYGKGVRARDGQEAAKLAGQYKADRKLLRERAAAALEVLRKHELVDARHLAAIGFCFGGTTVLELARSGARLNGVVSFHGGLDTPKPEDAKEIKAKVLVLHGGDDPYVPPKDVQALWDEMAKARVDYQVVVYGGAVHSFTNPAAGNDPSKGAAYDETAARRSWEAMRVFFAELFR